MRVLSQGKKMISALTLITLFATLLPPIEAEAVSPVFGQTSMGTTEYPDGSLEKISNVAFPYEASTLYGTAYDSAAQKAYVVKEGVQETLTRFSMPDFSAEATLTLTAGSKGKVFLDSGSDRIIVVSETSPTVVTLVKMSDLTFISSFTAPLGVPASALVYDESADMLYAATGESPANVYKINVLTAAIDGSLTLAAGEDNVKTMLLNPATGKLYAFTYTYSGKVVRVDDHYASGRYTVHVV